MDEYLIDCNHCGYTHRENYDCTKVSKDIEITKEMKSSCMGEFWLALENTMVDWPTIKDIYRKMAAAQKIGETNQLAVWAMKHGLSTGHADNKDDLLDEMGWQLAELRKKASQRGARLQILKSLLDEINAERYSEKEINSWFDQNGTPK